MKKRRDEQKIYGLIGYPLAHSFSPKYFKEKFDKGSIQNSIYKSFPMANLDELRSLLKEVDGLNVTIPYKEEVIRYLDGLSTEAQEIGAVNTLKHQNGKWIGYNTDAYGFETSLNDFLAGTKVDRALILGTGGASKAVAFVLHKIGIEFTYVSRSKPRLTYGELTEKIVREHRLIINTTPLGTYPKVDFCPQIPYNGLSSKHFLYDLVYNPEKTLFLKRGETQGCRIKNGMDMLVLQAEKSWDIWNQQ